MATPTQSTPPPNGNPPFLPPVELPAVQLWQPKEPQHKLSPWHWAAIILVAPFLILFTAVGAYTCAAWAFNDRPAVIKLAGAKPTPTPTHHTQPPRPAYDLAGYKAVVSGSEEQTFVTALDRFRSDIKRLRFQTVTTDALTLSGAANAYLADLRKTNPPPAYQPAKLANITAAIYGRRAAATIQQAISSANLASLQTGSRKPTKQERH